MKKILMLLLCVVAFECGQEHSALELPTQSTLPAPIATSNGIVANAGATTTSSVFTQSVDFMDFADCALGGSGEQIHVTGKEHILTRITTNGNLISVTSQSNSQGFVAIGLTTGTRYQVVGSIEVTSNTSINKLPQTFSLVGNRNLISHGKTSNLVIHENALLTINANGTIKVEYDHVHVACSP